MAKNPKNPTADALLSEDEIPLRLQSERSDIPDDVAASIKDYNDHVNKTLAPMLLAALQASGDPREAYKVWKRFSETNDLVHLRAALREWKPAADKMFKVKNNMMRLEQQQEGHGRSVKKTAARNLRAGFETVSARRASKAKSGGDALNPQQDAIYQTFLYFSRLYQGPSADLHPLRAAIAPHMGKAVKEKLSSYDALEAHVKAKVPLVDEKTVKELHGDVLDASYKRFDKLAEESYTRDPKAIIPDYGFSAKQMPKDTKFGIEIEGFSAIKHTFPTNLHTLSEYLKEAGIDASPALQAKHTDYNEWTITYDNSIKDPMRFTGGWQTPHAITKNSSSFELVSSILKGQEGQSQLMTAINVLKKLNFRSNDTCGLHMHVSLEDPNKEKGLVPLDKIKNLVKALYKNQDAIDGLIHPERRGAQNKFALAIPDVPVAKFMKSVDDAKNISELVNVINPGFNRNSKFDMTGLVGGIPTIQYRCAGGANYLASTSDYAVILANFTKQALDNPRVDLGNVIKGLVKQRNELKQDQTAGHKRTAKIATSPAR